jgi:hypothetical protein
MSWDEEVGPCSRRCAASDAPIAPGEAYYSVLEISEGLSVRRDYAEAAWSGPPEGAIGWWRAQAPEAAEAVRLAPQDVLLRLFAELDQQPAEAELRYVLGLLLLRKRLLRHVETAHAAEGTEIWTLESPRSEETFELRCVQPSAESAAVLETRIRELAYGQPAASGGGSPPALAVAEPPPEVTGSTGDSAREQAA